MSMHARQSDAHPGSDRFAVLAMNFLAALILLIAVAAAVPVHT